VCVGYYHSVVAMWVPSYVRWVPSYVKWAGNSSVDTAAKSALLLMFYLNCFIFFNFFCLHDIC